MCRVTAFEYRTLADLVEVQPCLAVCVAACGHLRLPNAFRLAGGCGSVLMFAFGIWMRGYMCLILTVSYNEKRRTRVLLFLLWSVHHSEGVAIVGLPFPRGGGARNARSLQLVRNYGYYLSFRIVCQAVHVYTDLEVRRVAQACVVSG